MWRFAQGRFSEAFLDLEPFIVVRGHEIPMLMPSAGWAWSAFGGGITEVFLKVVVEVVEVLGAWFLIGPGGGRVVGGGEEGMEGVANSVAGCDLDGLLYEAQRAFCRVACKHSCMARMGAVSRCD